MPQPRIYNPAEVSKELIMKRFVSLVLVAVPSLALAGEYVDVTASGGGLFECRVDGVVVSTHTQEYKASAQASDLKLQFPDAAVICDQQKTLTATLTPAGVALVSGGPAPNPDPDPDPDPGSGPEYGSTTLTWRPPTHNTDGSPLTDLAGFKLYWGTSPGSYPNSLNVPDPGATSYTVTDLLHGRYYFVGTAYNSAGTESQFSNVTIKVVP